MRVRKAFEHALGGMYKPPLSDVSFVWRNARANRRVCLSRTTGTPSCRSAIIRRYKIIRCDRVITEIQHNGVGYGGSGAQSTGHQFATNLPHRKASSLAVCCPVTVSVRLHRFHVGSTRRNEIPCNPVTIAPRQTCAARRKACSTRAVTE